jgi:hypothetical protein
MGRNYAKELRERGIVLGQRRGRRTEDALIHKLVDSLEKDARALNKRSRNQRRADELTDLITSWRAAAQSTRAEFMNRVGLGPEDDHEGQDDV